MNIQFHKYHGTGNDFIILDNRQKLYHSLTSQQVLQLCDRRFGIGADGLMLLEHHDGYDFEMIYYNSDGNAGSMCGNGGRCMVKFAHSRGIEKTTYRFLAVDGQHEAEIDHDGLISLKMKDIIQVKEYHGDFILDTGSPHYVKMVNDVKGLDVVRKGKEIRNSNNFIREGINVNFVSTIDDDEIFVRTYERGVENETLSCGTGVTAAAVICYHNENGFNDVTVHTPGGKLSVEYDRHDEDHYDNIWLTGPAVKVFEGMITLNG
jgi:diaminopimelate epimerase